MGKGSVGPQSKYSGQQTQNLTTQANWKPYEPSYMEMLYWMKAAQGQSSAVGFFQAMDFAEKVYNEAYKWVASYKTYSPSEAVQVYRFKQDWKIARHIIGLQVRLVCEQVFWDLGGKWRSLITGFKPLG